MENVKGVVSSYHISWALHCFKRRSQRRILLLYIQNIRHGVLKC